MKLETEFKDTYYLNEPLIPHYILYIIIIITIILIFILYKRRKARK